MVLQKHSVAIIVSSILSTTYQSDKFGLYLHP